MSEIKNIPIEKLEIDPANIRPKPDITPKFMENIRDKGVLHNLIVRPRGEGKYGVIVGARRLVAARNLGFEELPCEVRQIEDDMEAKAISFAENIHRIDIPVWKKREVLREFYDATDKRKSKENRVKEVMDKLNVSRGKIGQYLLLDELPESFKVRLKEPRERSKSEKKLLEKTSLVRSEEAPIGEREEEPPSEAESLCQIPQRVAVKLAQSDEFLKLAKEDPARAHELATKATEVGQRRVDKEVLQPLRREMKEPEKTHEEEFEHPKPAMIQLTMDWEMMNALKEYADRCGRHGIHPKTAARKIIQEFLIREGYLEW